MRDLSGRLRGALQRHRIFDEPYALDLDPRAVASLEKYGRLHHRSHPARRAGENQVTGFQRHRTAEMGDLVEYIENHMLSIGVLPNLAVDRTSQLKTVRIAEFAGGDEPGAARRTGIERLPQAPLPSAQLPLPHGGGV